MLILVTIFLIIYIFSVCGLVHAYGERMIEPTFWTILLLITPIANTYAAIRMNKMGKIKEFFSWRKFIEDIHKPEV